MNADVYANSLFALSEEEGCTERVLEDLSEAAKLIFQNEGYAELLSSPVVELSERLALIDEAFKEAHIYVVNLLKLLCEKRSIKLSEKCAENFEKLYNRKNNIEKVTVITAVPLTDSLREKLIKKLSEESGKKIILEEKTDKSILGGIIVQTENSQTDASVRARLDKLKNVLASSGNMD